jgi:hypothetical protein
MSRFREELKVIPRAAWTTTFVLWTIGALGIGLFWYKGFGPTTDLPFLLLIPVVPLLILSVYVPLVGYVYGDARRRCMRTALLWTLLAIFIPNGIGILLYFVLRDPIPTPCPSCGAANKPGLAFCPYCGTAIRRSCLQCHCALEETWKNCAHCGQQLI